MKFQYRVSGKRFAIESPSSEKVAEWKIEARPGGWLVMERCHSDGSLERRRVAVHEKAGKLSVQDPVEGTFFGEITRLSAGTGAAAGKAAESDFTAQFPGKVRKVLVKDGSPVKKGDKLLLLEAMKMEFAIQAHVDGVVKAVKVTEGEQLSPGQLLLDFEEAAHK